MPHGASVAMQQTTKPTLGHSKTCDRGVSRQRLASVCCKCSHTEELHSYAVVRTVQGIAYLLLRMLLIENATQVSRMRVLCALAVCANQLNHYVTVSVSWHTWHYCQHMQALHSKKLLVILRPTI